MCILNSYIIGLDLHNLQKLGMLFVAVLSHFFGPQSADCSQPMADSQHQSSDTESEAVDSEFETCHIGFEEWDSFDGFNDLDDDVFDFGD